MNPVRAHGCWRQVTGTGTGPTVVLVHGTMDRSMSFGRVTRLLDELRVVRYDRRGYARSLALGAPTGTDQQVEDLLDVVGDRTAVVFGHSYGGTVALAAAQRHPERVAGLVVYECPMPWLPEWPTESAGAAAVAATPRPEDAAERFMRRMLGDRRWERLPPSTRAARRAEGPTLVAEIAQLRPPHPPAFDPGLVTVPVIAAHGTAGAGHHAEAVRTVAARAPHGRLRVLDGVGHGVHLTHPALVAGLVREQLEVVARNA